MWPVRSWRRWAVCGALRRPRRARLGRHLAEDIAGLVADVGGAVAQPPDPAVDHSVEGVVVAEPAVCGDLRDHGRHLGVVAPLARGVGAEPAADHPRRLGRAQRCRAELVRHPERVTARRPEQHALDAVGTPGGVVVRHDRPASGGAERTRRRWGWSAAFCGLSGPGSASEKRSAELASRAANHA